MPGISRPLGLDNSAGLVADGDDLVLRLVEELGGVRADIAKALQGDARLLRLAVEMREQLEGENADAAAGRFFAALDAIVLDRLARDAGGIEAVIFFPLVANPGHLAPGGAHVGGRNVVVRAEDVVNLIDEVPRDSLQLFDAHACAGRWRCPPCAPP